MRAVKIALLLVFIVVVGCIGYLKFIYPKTWYSENKHASIEILKSANSLKELTNAVGYIGIFIPLTNNEWIAIRYRDSHGGGVYSCAVARDSGGEWFESSRHFCGSLQGWPSYRARVESVEEMKRTYPENYTNRVFGADSDNGMFPSYREMMAIEAAANLETAREALVKIGFKPLKE